MEALTAASMGLLTIYDMCKAIDRAKGLLMEQKGLAEDAAYKLLRKLAMDQNKRIGDVAHDLVTYARVLKK